METVLQKVQMQYVKVGQKVKFIGKRAWWIVEAKTVTEVVIRRGKRTWRLGINYTMLQPLFANL